MKKLLWFFIGILVLISGIVVYGLEVEPRLLITKEIDLRDSKEEQIKIVAFGDTQLGEYYGIDDLKKVVNKINDQKPDIVVFSGDLLDHAATYQNMEQVKLLLAEIETTRGKFAIYGNHDYGGGGHRYYVDIMTQSGFKVLKNEKVVVSKGNRKVSIFGLDDVLLGKPDYNRLKSDIENDGSYNILLVHEPDYVERIGEIPTNLIVSGHSHGGQVRVPFYGQLIKNKGAIKYTKGLYDLADEGNGKLFVTSGLGNTKMKFRMGNIPEIIVFQI